MTSKGRDLDLVIFGATGFTGKHVVEYLAKISEEEKGLKWAVAGRSKEKLQNVLKNASTNTGKDLNNIPVIEATVDNEASLVNMCKQAKLVLNCVGPYIFYGEPVVKACVENGCHHIDISGEPAFVESMQIKYSEEARKNKVYIIGAAGFDSIPCETGIQYLQEKFGGDVNSIETLLHLKYGSKRLTINFGTFQSIIRHFANEGQLHKIHSQIFTKPMPKSSEPLKSRGTLFYSKDIKKWCIAFPSTDVDVVNRTQYYNYHNRQMRPIQAKVYLVLPNLFIAIGAIISNAIMAVMSRTKWGRYLLETYPSAMTLGMFSKKGPTKQQIEETSFDMFLIGHGYEEKLAEPQDQHKKPPTKKMVVRVQGPEAAYVTTPIVMTQAALTVLQETEKLPEDGGVFTPGAAFLKTNLISRLQKQGIKYDVISQ